MRYLSVCSGIEAASVAFEPLGWTPLAFSEIEPFPCSVLAHHYPSVPNFGDMTKFREWDTETLSKADILVGGTPCQAFSVAGLRAGLDDERGQLTLTYIRLLDHIDNIRSLYGEEPTIAVWENVPGVLSSKDNAFGAFLGGLAGEDCELLPPGKRWPNAGCVYGPKRTIAWRVLDAQYFGLAQRRKRVFVAAGAGGIDPSEILFEFDGVRRDTPPSREAGERIAPTVTGGAPFSRTGNERVGCEALVLMDQGGSVMGIEKEVTGTLCRETHGYEPIVFTRQSSGEFQNLGIGSTLQSRDFKDFGDLVTYALAGSMIGRKDHNGSNQNGGGQLAIAFAQNQLGEIRIGEVSGTLNTNSNATGRNAPLVQQSMQVRRLTPVECERLQGFPDNYTNAPHKGKPAADGPRYKALGNSMAVPVMRWIGERIDKFSNSY